MFPTLWTLDPGPVLLPDPATLLSLGKAAGSAVWGPREPAVAASLMEVRLLLLTVSAVAGLKVLIFITYQLGLLCNYA